MRDCLSRANSGTKELDLFIANREVPKYITEDRAEELHELTLSPLIGMKSGGLIYNIVTAFIYRVFLCARLCAQHFIDIISSNPSNLEKKAHSLIIKSRTDSFDPSFASLDECFAGIKPLLL